jgi:hypothetical protein
MNLDNGLFGRTNWDRKLLHRLESAQKGFQSSPALGIFVFIGKDTVFLQIVDAFYDKIQNAAYSYSGSWLLAGQDEEEDAAFVKPAHAEEALPGPDSFAEGSQDELV